MGEIIIGRGPIFCPLDYRLIHGKCWYLFILLLGNFEVDQTSHLLYKFITTVVSTKRTALS